MLRAPSTFADKAGRAGGSGGAAATGASGAAAGASTPSTAALCGPSTLDSTTVVAGASRAVRSAWLPSSAPLAITAPHTAITLADVQAPATDAAAALLAEPATTLVPSAAAPILSASLRRFWSTASSLG